jgi:hypothetical protein
VIVAASQKVIYVTSEDDRKRAKEACAAMIDSAGVIAMKKNLKRSDGKTHLLCRYMNKFHL